MTHWTRPESPPYVAGRANADSTNGETQDPHAPVDDGHWLRHCHGYRVDSPRGRVGIVEDVLYGADHDRPAALAVRGGLLGRRLELIPIEEVDTIHPRRNRLVLRASAGHRSSPTRPG